MGLTAARINQQNGPPSLSSHIQVNFTCQKIYGYTIEIFQNWMDLIEDNGKFFQEQPRKNFAFAIARSCIERNDLALRVIGWGEDDRSIASIELETNALRSDVVYWIPSIKD